MVHYVQFWVHSRFLKGIEKDQKRVQVLFQGPRNGFKDWTLKNIFLKRPIPLSFGKPSENKRPIPLSPRSWPNRQGPIPLILAFRLVQPGSERLVFGCYASFWGSWVLIFPPNYNLYVCSLWFEPCLNWLFPLFLLYFPAFPFSPPFRP